MNLLLHPDYRVRENQALGHIAREQQNITVYNALLKITVDEQHRNNIKTRIIASTNYINGWLKYIKNGCPLERRAQVRLNTYPRATKDMFK